MNCYPQKRENPAATGLNAEQSTNSDDSTTNEKRLATLIAKFALNGHQVHQLADGGFIVSRWCQTRVVPDFAGLVAVGRLMGVQ